MYSRNFVFTVLLGACVSLSASQCSASIVSGLLFGGEANFLSDNSGEFVIDANGTPGVLDPGDIIVTGFDIGTIEGLSTAQTKSVGGSSGNPELSGLSIIRVDTKSAPTGVGPLGLPTFDFTFLPVAGDAPSTAVLKAALRSGLGSQTADELALETEFMSWATGSMVAVFGDTTPDYTRVGAGDDGSPDLGVGPFASEAALLLTAFNGVKQLEYGIPGLIPPFGTNLFWSADDALDAFSAFALLPAAAAGGDFDFGLDITKDLSGVSFVPVPNFDPLTGTLGTSMIAGSGELKGILGATTPFDAFDNVDLVVQVAVPEACAFVTWLGIALSYVCAHSRRSRIGSS